MCKERYINLLTDFGFKKMFGTEQNKEYLISFLNALLDEEDEIVEIQYRNVEKLGFTAKDRSAVYDLYCTTETGSHLIVEMQRAPQEYFLDRTIYYSSFPMQEAAERGDWDFQLPKIYTVAFLNFKLDEYKDNPEYRHVAKLTDMETHQVFYDKLTYIYIELPKFRKEVDELHTVSDMWLFILKNLHRLNSIPLGLPTLMQKFFEIAEICRFGEDERLAYEISLKNYRDYNNTLTTAEKRGREEGRAEGLAEGRAEGLAEGRAEGLAEGRAEGRAEGLAEGIAAGRAEGMAEGMAKREREIVIRMKREGMSNEQIASFTGLSAKAIAQLLTP